MPQIIVIPFDGQEIGQGYNSDTRESIGTGLSVANVSEDPAADGQVVTTLFEIVTSQESLIWAKDPKIAYRTINARAGHMRFLLGLIAAPVTPLSASTPDRVCRCYSRSQLTRVSSQRIIVNVLVSPA